MTGRRLIASGLLLGLVACSPRPVRSSGDLAQSEGAMFDQVAAELAKLAAPSLQAGGRVLVVRGSAACTAAELQESLEQSLRKHLGGAEVVVVPQPDVKPPPDMPDLPLSPQPLTAAWLAPHVARHKPAVVICLYSEPDAGVGVPLVCHSPAGPPKLAELIKSGAVLGAVTSVHQPAKGGGSSWFDQRYTVLTRDNVGAW
jgi:hypothetical protein